MARPLAIDDPITVREDGKPDRTTTKGEAILRAVAIGVPKEIAAQASGVSTTTFFRWQAQGEEYADMEAKELNENQLRLRQFWEDLQKTEARAVVFAMGMVRAAMPQSWQAAMTFLERRRPDHFARRAKVEHGGKITHELDEELNEAIEHVMEDLARSRQAETAG
jgi:hypothetical protein